MKTVSVILPTYNRARLLEKAVKSVLNQTYQDLELIIVDDGSTDDTGKIVKCFIDTRIKYIKNDVNKGLPSARNTGIKHSSGEYIAFQDSDDEWLDWKLEKQMDIFNNLPGKVGIVYSGVVKINGNRKFYVPYKTVRPVEGDLHKLFLMGNFMAVISVVARKSCFYTDGFFDETLPSLEDWELWLRLSKNYHFKYLNKASAIVRFTRDSLTAQRERYIKALKMILERHYDDFSENKKALAKIYGQIAVALYLYGKPQEGRKYSLKAVKSTPLDLRYMGLLAMSCLDKRITAGIFHVCQQLKESLNSVCICEKDCETDERDLYL